MKSTFFEYYSLEKSEKEHIFKEGLLIFDACVLLNFYRYSQETVEDLFGVLEKNKDRIWVPYQFAKEYQKNRIQIINEQSSSYKVIKEIIKNFNEKINSEMKNFLKHPFLKIENNIISEYKKLSEQIINYINDAESKHPEWLKNDSIRDRITKLFENKVGLQYNEINEKEITEEGKIRYSKKIPPGYLDQEKESNEYGDLIGWFQIIDKAVAENKDIVFITDEKKEDWWFKINGEIVSPRRELIRELRKKSNRKLLLYRVEKFLEQSGAKSETIKEIKEVREQQTKQEDELITGGFMYDSIQSSSMNSALTNSESVNLGPLGQLYGSIQSSSMNSALTNSESVNLSSRVHPYKSGLLEKRGILEATETDINRNEKK